MSPADIYLLSYAAPGGVPARQVRVGDRVRLRNQGRGITEGVIEVIRDAQTPGIVARITRAPASHRAGLKPGNRLGQTTAAFLELLPDAFPLPSPETKLAELAAAHRRTLAGRALRDLPPADAFRCRMLRGRAEKLCRAYASKPEREAAWQQWQADASAGPAAGKGSGGIVAGLALLAVGLFAAATARAASQPTPETLPPSL